ncbi:MAG: hypothetical protein AAB074_21460 [Planctomycetota bacterium]
MKHLSLFFLLTLATAAAADKIVLKDGRAYEGVVLEETDQSVKIKTSKATLTIPRDQIASFERAAVGPLQERETRLGTLDPAKPAEYVAVANWLTGPGREALDLSTLRRLCTIASKFDRALAWEAQMLLAKETEAAGLLRESGACLARAELAKPGDAGTRAKLEKLREALMRDARAEMEQLQKNLLLVIGEKYEESLPKLRKCLTGAMSERSWDHLGMSMEQLLKDVARRVMCTTCNGHAEVTCPGCQGARESDCEACEGTGQKKDYVSGREVNLAESTCRTCFGLGKFLCHKCKAERKVLVYLATAPTLFTIVVTGGSEKDALQKDIDLKRFTHRAIKITMIKAEPPMSGGTLPCKTCDGVKFDASPAPLPMDKLRAFRDEVSACLDGSKTYNPLPSVEKVWDPAIIADEMLRYRSGKWSR